MCVAAKRLQSLLKKPERRYFSVGSDPSSSLLLPPELESLLLPDDLLDFLLDFLDFLLDFFPSLLFFFFFF